MLTYIEAGYLFNKAKNKSLGKPIGNNTRLVDRGTHYAVRLHSTDVVEIYPNGVYKIRSGGWQTVTTKQRINKYSPVKILQRGHVWWVWSVGSTVNTQFYEGMRVTA